MLNYSDFKNYFTKFYADAFEDAKTFWKDYARNVERCTSSKCIFSLCRLCYGNITNESNANNEARD